MQDFGLFIGAGIVDNGDGKALFFALFKAVIICGMYCVGVMRLMLQASWDCRDKKFP